MLSTGGAGSFRRAICAAHAAKMALGNLRMQDVKHNQRSTATINREQC
jgi:hypothetical protein